MIDVVGIEVVGAIVSRINKVETAIGVVREILGLLGTLKMLTIQGVLAVLRIISYGVHPLHSDIPWRYASVVFIRCVFRYPWD